VKDVNVLVRVLCWCFFVLMTTMSRLFDSVQLSPPVEVFALNAAFNDDTDSHKVNLSIGGNCDF